MRADLPILVSLWKAYIREMRPGTKYYGPADARAIAFWKKGVRSALAGRKAQGYVAESGGRIVAMLFVERFEHDPHIRPRVAGYVHSAYVRPAHRRRGILKALAREAEQWCTERGIPAMAAWVLVDNREALAIWKRLGYRTSAEYLIKG